MSQTVVIHRVPLGRLGRLRDLLGILREIGSLDQPLTTLEGLREALALLLRVAELVGIDETWRAKLEALLANDALLAVVLAVVQWVIGRMGREDEDGTLRISATSHGDETLLDAQSFFEWLPLVLEIISIWRMIREAR